MKQFLKFTLATIVGVIIAILIGVGILFGVIGSIAGKAEKSTKVEPNSVYVLELKGQLVERSQNDPFSETFSSVLGQDVIKNIGLDDVLSNIAKAKADKNIKGIYLKDGLLIGGYASMKEIRDALLDFKKSGKFIVSYADTYTQKDYYLCSVADKMYLNPQGMLEFRGIASNTMFFKNTLDKLGVEMQIVKVGTYKSAVEPYVNTKMSDANKEQVTVFVNSIWNNVLKGISESRKIAKDSLNHYADLMMTFRPAEDALKYKLVDSLTYADGMDNVLKKLVKQDKIDDVNFITHSQMINVPTDAKMQRNKIAVIYASGGIDMGETDGIDSKKLAETILQIKDDDAVKSVVFRVNSGGGSAYGSEQIWHAIVELKKVKPVIVSMGDYAASGGYYISCAADSIIAQPNTLTGSIGIFGTFPNIAGLNQKIGLTFDGVKTNKMSDAITISRPFTPDERDLMQAYVNRGYELFVKRCADGRKMKTEAVKAIAEGRVWTGEDALRIGLVDKLGTIDDAVKIAAKKAKLTEYRIKSYPEKEDIMTRLMKQMESGAEEKLVKARLGLENYRILKQIEQAKNLNGIQALMPFEISLN